MRTTLAAVFGAAVAFAWSLPAGAAEQEEKIPLKNVPAAVRTTADKAVAGAKWEEAEKEVEHGQTLYEIKGKEPAKHREVEVEVTPDGKLIQVETEVAYNEVPDVVRNALKTRYPDFKPKDIKAVTQEGAASGYEFEGPGTKSREFEVFISGDGQTVTVKED